MKKILAIIGWILLIGATFLSTFMIVVPVLKQQAVSPFAWWIIGIPLEISFGLLYLSEKDQTQKRVFKGCMIVMGVVILALGMIKLIGIVL